MIGGEDREVAENTRHGREEATHGYANQAGATTPISKPVPHAQPSFDDLHAHITTRAYELYIQRGCREGCAMDDWLDAEREIVSREFPVSLGSGRGDSL